MYYLCTINIEDLDFSSCFSDLSDSLNSLSSLNSLKVSFHLGSIGQQKFFVMVSPLDLCSVLVGSLSSLSTVN